jgi:hypothetical protein
MDPSAFSRQKRTQCRRHLTHKIENCLTLSSILTAAWIFLNSFLVVPSGTNWLGSSIFIDDDLDGDPSGTHCKNRQDRVFIITFHKCCVLRLFLRVLEGKSSVIFVFAVRLLHCVTKVSTSVSRNIEKQINSTTTTSDIDLPTNTRAREREIIAKRYFYYYYYHHILSDSVSKFVFRIFALVAYQR